MRPRSAAELDRPDRHRARLLAVAHAARRAFDAAERRPTASERPAQRVFAALDRGQLTPVHPTGTVTTLPVCRQLEPAVASARALGGPIAELALAIHRAGPHLGWERRADAMSGPASFADGHANARLLRSESTGPQVSIGVSLMAPHVCYPDHRHPPEEVYLVLGPGAWRQEEDPWHEPGPGGVVHNPPDIVHAMRSGDEPLLAVWLHVVDDDRPHDPR